MRNLILLVLAFTIMALAHNMEFNEQHGDRGNGTPETQEHRS